MNKKVTAKAQKDYVVRGDSMFHAVDGRKIGQKGQDGHWRGPHPWQDEELQSATPDGLRELQRELAEAE